MILSLLCIASFVYADDEIAAGSTYRLFNKDTGKALQIYSADYPHSEIVSNQYKLFAKNGEITVYRPIEYRGQAFELKQVDNYYTIESILYLDKTILGVAKDEKLRPNAKVELLNPYEADKYSVNWKLTMNEDGYYTIVNSQDENLVLTQYGDFQVRFKQNENTDVQRWRLELITEARSDEEENEQNEKAKDDEKDKYKTEAGAAIDAWFESLEERIEKHQGLDFDGAYGSQCVDLIYDYTYNIFHKGEVRGAYRRSINGGNGGEIYATASSKYYQKIPYKAGVRAQRGDIVVYSKGYYGHSAVVEFADKDGFDVITINGSRGRYVRRQRYNNNSGYYQTCHLVGLLRPRKEMLVK